MSFTMLALLGLAISSPHAMATNPLGKVVDLLTDLSAKVSAEGEAEAASFKEYSEWCDDTATDKKFEIKTATSQKEKLEAKISELSGSIEVADSKIADLAADISAATAELKNATGIREKEAADFAAGEKELMDVIDTLGRAVTILEREMQKSPASFAQLNNNANFAGMLKSLSAIVDAASFSASDKERLLAFAQSKQSTDDFDSELGAPAAAVYESHSSSIFDTLEDLKAKAESQLSDLRKAEVDAKHNYAMLKQSLEDQMAADTKDLDEEKAGKAAAEEDKAASEGDLEVTTADLTATKESLETLTATCEQVTSDHEATVTARAEELKVITEAIGVLKETTSGAVSQTYSFLQLGSATSLGIRSRSDLKRSEISTLVKKLARKHHSAALAQLASQIGVVMKYGSGNGDDPFAKVKGLIKDMISKLETEAGAEATEKAFCDEEMAKTASKKDELDTDISKLTSKIDSASARSAELKEEVKELQSELAAMAKEQAEMDKIRTESHENFVQAKSDLELGLTGVRKALVVLKEYYAADEGETEFVQQPAKPKLFAAGTGSGTSIIGILEVVESDFASNLAKEETEEATAAEDYEKATQENKVTKAAKDQDVKYKTQEFTSLDKEVAELSADRETASTELSAVLEYDTKLKDRCIAKPETYEARKARREAEIAGLKEAMSILENEAAFVQRGSKQRGHHMRGTLSVDA